MASKTKPLPLSETLRDLALLRASDVNLSSLLPTDGVGEPSTPVSAEVNESVERSYEFAREARAVIKIASLGGVDGQGERIEKMRARLEDVRKGLGEGEGLGS
jgi:hypothetical protein